MKAVSALAALALAAACSHSTEAWAGDQGKAPDKTRAELEAAMRDLQASVQRLEKAMSKLASDRSKEVSSKAKEAGKKIEAGLAQMLSGLGDALHAAARNLGDGEDKGGDKSDAAQ